MLLIVIAPGTYWYVATTELIKLQYLIKFL